MTPITVEQTNEVLQKQAFLGNWIRSMRLKPEQASKYVQKQVQLADDVMGGKRLVSMDTPAGTKALAYVTEGRNQKIDFSNPARIMDQLSNKILAGTLGHTTNHLNRVGGPGGFDDIAAGYVITNPKGWMGQIENALFGNRSIMAHELAEANAMAQRRAVSTIDPGMTIARMYRIPRQVIGVADAIVPKYFPKASLAYDSWKARMPMDEYGNLLSVRGVAAFHEHPSVYIAESLAGTSPLQKLRGQFGRWVFGEGDIVKKSLMNPGIASDISIPTQDALKQLGVKFDSIRGPFGLNTYVNTRKGLFS